MWWGSVAQPYNIWWLRRNVTGTGVVDVPSALMAEPLATSLPFTGDPESDALLIADPMALLIGFELDQQVTVQKAFSGPLELVRRVGTIDARRIAEMDPETLVEAFRRPPALHRFPRNMAGRVRELCAAVARDYGADPTRIWTEAKDGQDLRRRLRGLPGIGDMKADALIVILVRRLGIRPSGWEAVMPDHPTLGDVDSPESLASYQASKRALKASLREAGKRP
jgi:uncharacterized HhH-GPD family protein